MNALAKQVLECTTHVVNAQLLVKSKRERKYLEMEKSMLLESVLFMFMFVVACNVKRIHIKTNKTQAKKQKSRLEKLD